MSDFAFDAPCQCAHVSFTSHETAGLTADIGSPSALRVRAASLYLLLGLCTSCRLRSGARLLVFF